MKKNIFQIAGIILFFFLTGFVLTYPYELSYHGNDEIILLEDSYEKTSLEELINRNEFKGKVLYIRIWEPFDTEIKAYSEKELATFQSQLDTLKDNIDSDEYKLLSMKLKGQIVQGVSIEDQLNAIEMLLPKYKNDDVAFVYITYPDNNYQNRKDDFRKWKTAVKRYKTPGYHLVMNPELGKQVRRYFTETATKRYLPYYLLVNKQGKIVDYQAPWPQDTALLYPMINQLLAH
jgi:hypothetical protein